MKVQLLFSAFVFPSAFLVVSARSAPAVITKEVMTVGKQNVAML